MFKQLFKLGLNLFFIVYIPLQAFLNDPSSFRLMVRLILIAWTVHILNWTISGGGLSYIFGIHPREIFSLPSIILGHFLHIFNKDSRRYKNYHLSYNTKQFWIVGSIITAYEAQLLERVTILIALTSGIGTWLFGRANVIYLGAQTITFGYISFLLMYGIHGGIPEKIFSRKSLENLPKSIQIFLDFIYDFLEILGNVALLTINVLTGKAVVGPGKLAFLFLIVLNLLIFNIKFSLLEKIKDILGKLLKIEKLQAENKEVPDDDPSLSIRQEEEFLSQVLQVLFIRYPESVIWGLIGGVFAAYFIMLQKGAT